MNFSGWFFKTSQKHFFLLLLLLLIHLSPFFGIRIIDTLTDLACARHALTNNESQKKTVIGHLLASQGEHNMNMNHIRSIMAELVFGGIDTVFFCCGRKNKKQICFLLFHVLVLTLAFRWQLRCTFVCTNWAPI